ncbi:PAS domain-containing protein [Thiospirochaeta perfilievii]|uniref:histidine kinase n=1 Tax=Thiospirochaeta perfilievii TaxID=252967 RepID=A0A5C1QAF0_9SPIO|nr:ATP-binding protein [Thiospirochaeta perfilievii]QEN05035.1 PAS domain-containing protein [Thiospirochaeta perfilievii]
MKQRSIFTTLFSIFLVIILLSIGVSAIYSITTFNNFIYKIEKDRLVEKTEILLDLFPVEDIHNIEKVDRFTRAGINGQTRITVIDNSGVVLSDSIKDSETMDNHLYREEIQDSITGRSVVVLRFSDTLDQMMMYYSLPIEYKSKSLGFLRTSISVDLLEKRVQVVTITITIISIVLILLSVAICYIMTIKFSITINSIKRVAGCYAVGEFNNSLSENGPREIASLSKSINNMGNFLQERISTVVKQKNRYKSMLESMHEPVIRINNNFIIDEINRSAELLFNKKDKYTVGNNIRFLTDNEIFLEFVTLCLNENKSLVKIIPLSLDKKYHFQIHSSILYDADNNRLGILLVMNDLTEHVRLEGMRKEFVANVSHEIRTPATAIQGYIETLIHNDVSLEQREKFLKIIYRHSNRLNSIIDDLLMLAGLEKSDSSFQFEKFPVSDLISSATNIVSVKAEKSLIEIVFNIGENHQIYAHPLLAEQALTNLLSNSIKYSPKGSTIRISTRYIHGGLMVEVQDEGCGIPLENQEQIFERFYRVDRGRSRDQGGTGLGLSIVKRVMNIHGGNATLESKVDKGSTFRLFFPGE